MAISLGFFGLETEPMSLHLRVPESFWVATPVGAQEEVSQQGVNIGLVLGLREVPCQCCFSELSVVPVGDGETPSLTVHKMAWEVAPQTSPEKGRDTANRRKVILVEIIQNLCCILSSTY